MVSKYLKQGFLFSFLLFSLGVSVYLVGQAVNLWPRATVDPTDTSYDLGVLVIKYFPLAPGGVNIDISVTGDVGESYTFIRQKTFNMTHKLKESLEKATSYLGYKNSAAQPALRYNIVDSKEYTQAVPIKPRDVRVTYPDYNKVMQDHNICDYVDNKNVREVWLWAYQGPNKPDTDQPYLGIDESKMSGPQGDISNSWHFNDMPVCSHTYRVLTFNYSRGTAEAMESWGHQMEAELDAVDSGLFRVKYQGFSYPPIHGQIGRCGSVHNPPNARFEYDRENPDPWQSDCLDWNPDLQGELSNISCQMWTCVHNFDISNPGLNYQIWHWQNLPGRGNTKTYQGKNMRNWWDVHGDFDNVMAANRSLYLSPGDPPTPTVSPTPIISPTPTVSPTPTPTHAPRPGDLDADGDLDIFDYNILISHFGNRMPPEGSPADFDKDNDVDAFDYNLFIGYYYCRDFPSFEKCRE